MSSFLGGVYIHPVKIESVDNSRSVETLSLSTQTRLPTSQRWQLDIPIALASSSSGADVSANYIAHRSLHGTHRSFTIPFPQVPGVNIAGDTLLITGDAGDGGVTVHTGDASELDIGRFISIGDDAKVYVVTAAVDDDNVIGIFPSLEKTYDGTDTAINQSPDINVRYRFGDGNSVSILPAKTTRIMLRVQEHQSSAVGEVRVVVPTTPTAAPSTIPLFGGVVPLSSPPELGLSRLQPVFNQLKIDNHNPNFVRGYDVETFYLDNVAVTPHSTTSGGSIWPWPPATIDLDDHYENKPNIPVGLFATKERRARTAGDYHISWRTQIRRDLASAFGYWGGSGASEFTEGGTRASTWGSSVKPPAATHSYENVTPTSEGVISLPTLDAPDPVGNQYNVAIRFASSQTNVPPQSVIYGVRFRAKNDIGTSDWSEWEWAVPTMSVEAITRELGVNWWHVGDIYTPHGSSDKHLAFPNIDVDDLPGPGTDGMWTNGHWILALWRTGRHETAPTVVTSGQVRSDALYPATNAVSATRNTVAARLQRGRNDLQSGDQHRFFFSVTWPVSSGGATNSWFPNNLNYFHGMKTVHVEAVPAETTPSGYTYDEATKLFTIA